MLATNLLRSTRAKLVRRFNNWDYRPTTGEKGGGGKKEERVGSPGPHSANQKKFKKKQMVGTGTKTNTRRRSKP